MQVLTDTNAIAFIQDAITKEFTISFTKEQSGFIKVNGWNDEHKVIGLLFSYDDAEQLINYLQNTIKEGK